MLLRHVLRAIPNYHLMVLSLTHDSYNELEKVCRIYLWGTNKEGKPKKTIIAWDDITRPKGEGGMDIRPFNNRPRH